MSDGKKWVSRFLDQNELSEIAQSIAEVESQTQIEMVVALQKRASSYAPTTGLMLTLISLSLLLVLIHPADQHAAYWAAVSLLVLCALTPFIVRKSPQLYRRLVSKSFVAESVHLIMDSIFYNKTLFHTAERNCILIFVSFDEHYLSIRTDVGAAGVLKDADAQQMIEIIAQHFKKSHYKQGIVESLKFAGRKMISAQPARSHNPNELANEVLVLDYFD